MLGTGGLRWGEWWPQIRNGEYPLMNINLAPAIGNPGICGHPEIPQGLKPSLFWELCGTTEVVP